MDFNGSGRWIVDGRGQHQQSEDGIAHTRNSTCPAIAASRCPGGLCRARRAVRSAVRAAGRTSWRAATRSCRRAKSEPAAARRATAISEWSPTWSGAWDRRAAAAAAATTAAAGPTAAATANTATAVITRAIELKFWCVAVSEKGFADQRTRFRRGLSRASKRMAGRGECKPGSLT